PFDAVGVGDGGTAVLLHDQAHVSAPDLGSAGLNEVTSALAWSPPSLASRPRPPRAFHIARRRLKICGARPSGPPDFAKRPGGGRDRPWSASRLTPEDASGPRSTAARARRPRRRVPSRSGRRTATTTTLPGCARRGSARGRGRGRRPRW